MFKFVSLVSNLAKLGSWLARLINDAKLRQEGRNQVAAEAAVNAEEARREAHSKIRTADDATAAARRRLLSDDDDAD